jgi:hypothetical protein
MRHRKTIGYTNHHPKISPKSQVSGKNLKHTCKNLEKSNESMSSTTNKIKGINIADDRNNHRKQNQT